MSKVSLVVPVYNVEDYLDACLESLTGQTLSDIEIICVNDGSTDCSRDLLEKWANRDARVRVIDKPNGGPSSARNVGIEVATGEIVCFPDADDRMLPQACETIASVMDETGADVMTFGATWVPEADAESWLREALSPRDMVFEGFSTDLIFKENSRPFAWRTACKMSLLRKYGVRFEETLDLGEDQAFQFAVYPRSKRTVLSSERLYEYRIGRPGSLMGKDGGDFAQKMLKHVNVIERIFADWERGGFLYKYGPEMVTFALDFALYDALKLDDSSYQSVAGLLQGVLEQYWSEDEVIKMSLPSATKKMAISSCYHREKNVIARKRLVFEYHAQQHGLRSALLRVMGL